LPEVTAHRPTFPSRPPILTCILWCSILAAWIILFLTAKYHSQTILFFLMLSTILLFAAGLIILGAAAITHATRLRRYLREQQALSTSQPISSSNPGAYPR
jgi:hypothetical protein